ncbi:MAG: IS1634 family transposase [Muribaculaceae bacterium]|nr:IS1634 family transposase [Muribaculaceae bacterium]
MKLKLVKSKIATTAYVQKSVREGAKVTTKAVMRLGTLEEIALREGCADPLAWCRAKVAEMTAAENDRSKAVVVQYNPGRRVKPGSGALRLGGDMLLAGLYRGLGLPGICAGIQQAGRSAYDLNEILRTLVMGRILFPGSKWATREQSRRLVKAPRFAAEQMYRSLSLLSGSIDTVQAEVFRQSKSLAERRTGVIFYDCTNYYFETDEEDGLRRRGKSKEGHPNPIVQMGLFMDYDGIPLAFVIFPGNASEQPTLKPLEEKLAEDFDLTDFVVSTDAGLGSEDNRRYNTTEGREYICVQSLPQLSEKDRLMAIAPQGWRVAVRDRGLGPVDGRDPGRDVFNLDELDMQRERHTKFYKEILVEKRLNGKGPRMERVIVTYCHDFALYLRHKREQRLKKAEKIVKSKSTKSRQSQQDPRRYVETLYCTREGELAEHIAMSIDGNVVEQEQQLDGFYAYGTSLDDNAVDILRIRGFHGEIEHLFRTTKSFLEARPVYLQRDERIRSHFLICFLAMTILKILQKKLDLKDLTIDRLITTLREFNFNYVSGVGYTPLFERNELTDRLQEIAGLKLDYEIITKREMGRIYKSLM